MLVIDKSDAKYYVKVTVFKRVYINYKCIGVWGGGKAEGGGAKLLPWVGIY